MELTHNNKGTANLTIKDNSSTSENTSVKSSKIDSELARMIDHTLLKPDATIKDIEKLCEEAKKYNFASVCVNASFVQSCAKILKNTPIKVCTVIGFPLGATSTATKVFETKQSIDDGAAEVDMVMNIGMLKSGEDEYVENDISAVVKAAKQYNVLVKVILETTLLTNEEKIKACIISKRAGADFVKTSTGFAKGGATVEDVALMRKTVGNTMGVKASGGIRTRQDALLMIANGANRIGASASVNIVCSETETSTIAAMY